MSATDEYRLTLTKGVEAVFTMIAEQSEPGIYTATFHVGGKTWTERIAHASYETGYDLLEKALIMAQNPKEGVTA